ncbi:3950_t:CDS:2 [Entrophospora sp. SA101]|nr:3950_t:CDS:2 [Entrophospora sp. SA101]CAJ0830092.1 5997_t:CDS:2 [Entrophospora sp. SA101]CAJ0846446.1 9677_t:CDS:2 [Entrophospora sp. SA101]
MLPELNSTIGIIHVKYADNSGKVYQYVTIITLTAKWILKVYDILIAGTQEARITPHCYSQSILTPAGNVVPITIRHLQDMLICHRCFFPASKTTNWVMYELIP